MSISGFSGDLVFTPSADGTTLEVTNPAYEIELGDNYSDVEYQTLVPIEEWTVSQTVTLSQHELLRSFFDGSKAQSFTWNYSNWLTFAFNLVRNEKHFYCEEYRYQILGDDAVSVSFTLKDTIQSTT